jgi:hypothetical protein
MTTDVPAEVVVGSDASAAPATAPDATPVAPDGAAPASHWSASYPELVDHPRINEFETPAHLATSYLELEKTIGKKGVLVPKEGANEDEMSRFYAALGRPDNAESYFADWTPPENVPMDKGTISAMSAVFHEVGLTQGQAEKIRDVYASTQSSAITQYQRTQFASAENAFKALQDEYGTKYEGNINLANRFGELLMGAKGWESLMSKKFIDGTTLGNSPEFIRAAVNMGGKMGEDRVMGMGEVMPIGNTPEQAQAELDKLGADKEFVKILTNGDHPEHAAAKHRYDMLFVQLHPPQPA